MATIIKGRLNSFKIGFSDGVLSQFSLIEVTIGGEKYSSNTDSVNIEGNEIEVSVGLETELARQSSIQIEGVTNDGRYRLVGDGANKLDPVKVVE